MLELVCVEMLRPARNWTSRPGCFNHGGGALQRCVGSYDESVADGGVSMAGMLRPWSGSYDGAPRHYNASSGDRTCCNRRAGLLRLCTAMLMQRQTSRRCQAHRRRLQAALAGGWMCTTPALGIRRWSFFSIHRYMMRSIHA